MREAIRLSHAIQVIRSYNPVEPLSTHLKKYFTRHKQMGSNDRKICRELVYNYYRLGIALDKYEIEIRIACGNFLFTIAQSEMLDYLVATFLNFDLSKLPTSTNEKLALIQHRFPEWQTGHLFPFTSHLSAGIEQNDWLNSYFIKPMVWVRALKNKMENVKAEFDKLGLMYSRSPFSNEAFGFEPMIKITETESYKRGFIEIQDISSQRTINHFKPERDQEKWWDCCAGAGGKSLLLLDHYPKIELTVSDSRETILLNLAERFKKAGLHYVKAVVTDLSQSAIDKEVYDAVILDAPCTGSGTWNRTPERICTFCETEINEFAHRQKIIFNTITSSVKSGGKIIYITCSVFKEENEEVVKFMASQKNLAIETMNVIDGYHSRNDTLFLAVLRKRT